MVMECHQLSHHTREAIKVEIYKMNGNFYSMPISPLTLVLTPPSLEWKFPFILYISTLMASLIVHSSVECEQRTQDNWTNKRSQIKTVITSIASFDKVTNKMY